MKSENDDYFPLGAEHEDVFFQTGNLHFVWDKAKNEHNIRFHGIDFQTAALVFNDPFAITELDSDDSDDEDRYNETGVPVDSDDILSVPGFEEIPRAYLGEVDNILFVVYTMRYIKGSEFIRMISARPAVEDEITLYKEAKEGRYYERY